MYVETWLNVITTMQHSMTSIVPGDTKYIYIYIYIIIYINMYIIIYVCVYVLDLLYIF